VLISDSKAYSGDLQTFWSEGHMSCYAAVRGPDISRDVIVFGCCIVPNQQVFRKYIFFSLLTK